MTPFISVVIPTHNPRSDYLRRVLAALRAQTLPRDRWELIVVDNGSRQALGASVRHTADGMRPEGGGVSRTKNFEHNTTELELGWHPNARIVREEVLGLTHARVRGFTEAIGDLIVMVDDDNVLDHDYLEVAVEAAEARPALGAFGGKALPVFEVEPPEWLMEITSGLGLRDLGDEAICFPAVQTGKAPPREIAEFPQCAPIGAGMVLRREAAAAYMRRQHEGGVAVTDRCGDSLSSAGDNDICLTVLEEGWQVGYFPALKLQHLIPRRRMTLDYQRRMARESMQSFVAMLDRHGIRPWVAVPPWTVPLRIARDFFRVQPWRDVRRSLTWWMNCGRYRACAKLPRG